MIVTGRFNVGYQKIKYGLIDTICREQYGLIENNALIRQLHNGFD